MTSSTWSKKRPFARYLISLLLFVCASGTAGAVGPADNTGLHSYVIRNNINLDTIIPLYDQVCDILTDYGCTESEFVAAIVFPELMRYSQFRDTIESITTQLMYSSGVDYFNCSIGYMQMKPIFCVDIEKRIAQNERYRKAYAAIDFEGVEDTARERFQRVLRMKDLKTQCLYPLAFIDVCDSLYDLKSADELYRLKIISTAYNCGIKYSIDQLDYISTLPAFPYGTDHEDSHWIYSTIATDFYQLYTSVLKS